MTILIKRDPNAEPFDPLDVVNELPPIWNGMHVGLRLAEGFAQSQPVVPPSPSRAFPRLRRHRPRVL